MDGVVLWVLVIVCVGVVVALVMYALWLMVIIFGQS